MSRTPAQPATPYLAVDEQRVRRSIERVQRAADAAGVRLRPHVKTHKTPLLARWQREAGARGITVATIGEAEVFVGAGFDDVLVAYPVLLDDDRIARLRLLAERARVVLGIDSADGARRAAPLAGSGVEVAVEVDSGHHRTGVEPPEAGAVAAAAVGAGLPVHGVFTFPGHSYAPGAGASGAEQERGALAAAHASLGAHGLDAPDLVRSGGSTPSLGAALEAGDALDELRPGVYLFGDAQQWELGHCTPGQIGLTCVASVVSHAGGRMVLDSGSKVLGADRAGYATGFGRLLDDPDARIVMLSEHHAVVETPGPLPSVGSRVRVVPNHVCAAVNLADVLWIDGAPVPVAARGRND